MADPRLVRLAEIRERNTAMRAEIEGSPLGRYRSDHAAPRPRMVPLDIGVDLAILRAEVEETRAALDARAESARRAGTMGTLLADVAARHPESVRADLEEMPVETVTEVAQAADGLARIAWSVVRGRR